MTPKDKAFELVTKYSRILPMNQTTLLDRKNCALVAVNAILEQLNHLPTQGYGIEYQDVINYWKEVKQEIERL